MENERFYMDYDDYESDDGTRIIRMSEVEPQEVKWLWSPYIPLGKITVLQGDPGDGKTMLMLAVASSLTRGVIPAEENESIEPVTVIYQTAEDGLADTIRPRLDMLGADCSRVCVIDDSEKPLSLSDERIETAIVRLSAKLIILDPLQAYLGENVDMFRANEVRPIFRRIGEVAQRTGCAVVIVGHMNKGNAKALYRGLGSIDIPAAARSVLLVGRPKNMPDTRALVHVKSSLAPVGRSIGFEIADTFRWLGEIDVTVETLMQQNCELDLQSKCDIAAEELIRLLSDGDMPSEEVYKHFRTLGVSRRTVETAKKIAGVASVRTSGGWQMSLK